MCFRAFRFHTKAYFNVECDIQDKVEWLEFNKYYRNPITSVLYYFITSRNNIILKHNTGVNDWGWGWMCRRRFY